MTNIKSLVDIIANGPDENVIDDDFESELYMDGKRTAEDIVKMYGPVLSEKVIENLSDRWGDDVGNKFADELVDAMVENDIG